MSKNMDESNRNIKEKNVSIKDFDVPAPRTDVRKLWCSKLIDGLKEHFIDIKENFRDIKLSIDELRLSIKTDMNKIEQSLITEVKEAKAEAMQATKLANENSQAIRQLQAEFSELKSTCFNLKRENVVLKEQSNNLEMYSRKNNLIFRGIKEEGNETHAQCEAAIRHFFKNNLKIQEETVGAMPFVRCHRLRAMRWNSTRDIIVRFRIFGDREVVWSRKSELSGDKSFGISEDFPREIASNRRKLYPIFHRAKRSKQNVSLKGDRLIISGTTYTVSTLGKLEGDLHPRSFSEVSNAKVLAFGGILSEWHPFSNWSFTDISYEGRSFITLEHAYLHEKALTFRDMETAVAIRAAPDAQTAKMLSYNIKGVDRNKWDGMKEEVMKKLLKIKFAPGSGPAKELLATGNKKLAETGRDPFYACGLSITDKQILDTSKWVGNVLGRLLSDIRQELRA